MSFLLPNVFDLIDIALLAFVLYMIISLLKKTGGYQVLLGLGLIFILYFIASLLNLALMTSLLKTLKDYWVIAFIILFQKEIRNFFSHMAKNYDLKSFFRDSHKSVYTQIVSAVNIMSFRKIGALIIIEKKRKMDDYIESGEVIDARITVKLLLTIFNNKTILHDGAVVIRDNRVYAVKVTLPLSENLEHKQKFGHRHLAAIGISEMTDCFVIVVSEETGSISCAVNGEVKKGLTIDELSQKIKDEAS